MIGLVVVNITVKEVHRKGSGIKEQIEISQEYLSENIFKSFYTAITDFIVVQLRRLVTGIEYLTPDTPRPVEAAALINQEDQLRIIDVVPKRRKIGFINYEADTVDVPFIAHEKSTKTPDPDTGSKADDRQLKQRLKMYKKRLGQHQQKALKAKAKGNEVSSRTLSAIENNQNWINYYEGLLKE